MKRLIDEEDVIRAICKNCYAEDGGDYKDCRYYPCDDVQAIEALTSTDLEQIKAIMTKANEQDKHMCRPTDLISRADAIDAVVCHIWHMPNEAYRQFNCENVVREVVEDAIQRLPSAEAEPTVIRSKTLLPTKDFMEWAKRIKEVNPNAVVIPCDAEVASAETVQSYTEWLEKIIVMLEPEYLCEDTTDKEWCEENCHYSSIQVECLRHLYKAEQVTSKLNLADADWKRRVMMYLADLQLSCDPHTEIGKAKWEALETASQGIADMLSAEAVQIPIKLEKRYPESKDEDITDAFMRGYKSADAVQGEWIPCSERLPDDLAEVNVTWVNHDPEPYYDFVKDKPAPASAVFYKGKWFWYSSVCADILAEYGKNDTDEVDNAIEILAWMPLPTPYKGGDSE